MTGTRLRRRSWRDRTTRWSHLLRGVAIGVVLVGAAGSALLARGWQSTVDRERDERLDRSEFSTFARSLDLGERYRGLQSIRWRTVVTDDQAAAFVARNRADGEPGFTIRPPGRRPVYDVTQFSYPRIPSSSSIGADARSDPGLLATLERARDTGRTTVSNQTTLPGDLDLPPSSRPVAFELFVPVYRAELASDASVATRRRQFLGWAAGRFRAGDWASGSASCSGCCCGCWPRSAPSTTRSGAWPAPTP
jgi:CHASE1-domain containing sensor protein